MSISEIHGIYAARVFALGDSSETILDGVSNQSLNINSNITRERTSGSPYPRHNFIAGQTLNASLVTKRLEDWFDLIGFTGKKIEEDTGKPGLELYAQLFNEGTAGRQTGSNHRKYTAARAFIVPTQLSVDHQGDAMLTYQCHIIYDGTNDPIVLAELQAVPTLVGDDQRFGLGKVTLGSTVFQSVRSWQVDFNPDVRVEGADGDIWPTYVSVSGWSPTINITGLRSKWLGTGAIPISGLVCTHANTSLYLRKRAEGNNHFVADATAEHIKLTGAGIAVIDSAFDAGSGDSATTTIRLPLKYDGTNTPVVVATSQQIT